MFAFAAMLIAGLLFIGMLACSEAGRRIGLAMHKTGAEDPAKGAAAAEAAVFGLLGLLIAFTFSGAASRFDDRRHLITEEANAIETAYLRVDLLPADAQPELRELFRRYLDVRVATYQRAEDQAGTQAKVAEGTRLQREIWTRAWKAGLRPEVPIQAATLLLPAINQMIDVTTARQAATRNHPPPAVFLLLCGLSLVGALLVGYAVSWHNERQWLHAVVFAAFLSVTVYVIIDLEYPRLGLIRVDGSDQTLITLRHEM